MVGGSWVGGVVRGELEIKFYVTLLQMKFLVFHAGNVKLTNNKCQSLQAPFKIWGFDPIILLSFVHYILQVKQLEECNVVCSGRSSPTSTLIYIFWASLTDFLSFLVTDVLYPAYPKGQKRVPALFQMWKRNSYQALPVSLSQDLWFIEGKNKVETECACLKGTQPTFGKSSDNISCKCLLYKLYNIFSLLATVWLS